MHNRLCKLNDSNIFYPLQFGLRQKYFTSFALIHLSESIKEPLDQGKHGFGIFVDLIKAFDTVDHNTLIGKLKQYFIRGVACSWFESYLKGQFFMEFHKVLILDHYSFFFTSMICILL